MRIAKDSNVMQGKCVDVLNDLLYLCLFVITAGVGNECDCHWFEW